VEDGPGNEQQQADIDPADNLFHRTKALQPHDHLGAALEADHRADQHDHAEFVVNVAELAVPHGGDE
jgi:hypothetical protein